MFSPKVYSSKSLKVLSFIDTSLTLPTYCQFCCPLPMISTSHFANFCKYPLILGEFDVACHLTTQSQFYTAYRKSGT